MPSIDQLVVGKRYLFYQNESVYRGKFLELRSIYNYLDMSQPFQYIYIAADDLYNGKLLTKIIHTKFIIKVETLIETFQWKIRLPDDVLNVIDEYL
jgi:hypothetical protein